MTFIWENLKVETLLKDRLIRELGVAEGESIYNNYVAARNCLLTDILDRISSVEPNLTDHGPKHVKNVLNNVYDLLGEDIRNISGVELYILCKSVLFHDVGNLHNRRDHQKKISQIYEECCVGEKSCLWYEEKNAIIRICGAHCGESVEGDKDTIGYLNEYMMLGAHQIRIKILAPILRLADELAEGPQRTSYYMIKNFMYDTNSIVFQRYALVVSVSIDRPHDRIGLSYNIRISEDGLGADGTVVSMADLADFLTFIYRRIEKMNQERQYAKYYCMYLSGYKSLVATINFWYNGEALALNLNDIFMSDLVVPGEDPQKQVTEKYEDYKADRLIEVIRMQIADMS
jgi:hypothetical protein